MKRILLLLAVLLLLTGCQSLYPDEYLAVNEHEAPFAYRETAVESETATEPAPEYRIVSDVFALRDGIQDMVLRGEESAQFLVPGSTKERVEAAMQEVENTLVSSSPKYTYAMDSFEWYLEQADAGAVVTVRMKLRLAPQEIRAIETWIYPEPAMSKIYGALSQFVSSYTIQISGYQETDWYSLLDAYVLEHPDQIVEAPSISVYVFPDRGRIRVLELHFDYNTDQETLSQRKIEVNFFLNLILNQLSRSTPEEMVETISKYLLPGTGYVADPNATVYSQVVLKTGGSSRTMASTVAYLCNRAGAECEIVAGERDGVPWYWNRIMTDGRWRSFDLHAAALVGDFHPVLLPSEEMLGYSWDVLRYPEIPEPEPAEPTETGDPSETGDPTETGEPTEPTEPAEPTGPTEPTEPIQSTEAIESTETP